MKVYSSYFRRAAPTGIHQHIKPGNVFWIFCISLVKLETFCAKQQWSCGCLIKICASCPWHWLIERERERERAVQLSNVVNPAMLVILSVTLSVFNLLCLLPSVFLVTDGHCKQLCVTGLVAWFLLEWLCNSNPIAPCRSSPLPSPAPPSVSFYITIHVERLFTGFLLPRWTDTTHRGSEFWYRKMVFTLNPHCLCDPM